ncbi:hypothetical protein LR48_Vigan04g000400 [Vigna angularis]|uniref:Uncharacterized protein n=1 Tax=Phaseolus angularis TaxID=3914 RepID=A0A0L9UAR8_PHAAN|nr:hypothetical protein LR48_Vigan04g000400 [Vigna angularis]
MLMEDSRLATAAISQGWATLLHVAAEANHLHFVEELVKQLHPNDLELQDFKGNTAFCFAAAVGNVKIAEAMARRNSSLPTIRGGEGLTPLHMAALQGKCEMAWYLYPHTVHNFHAQDWDLLFFLCINTSIYDLALKMLQDNPLLALARNENKETGLHVLARKSSAFSCEGRRYPNQFINSRKNPSLAHQLVRCLWDTLVSLDCTEIQLIRVINEPSQVIFIAAEVGNCEIIVELAKSYPDLPWDVNDKNQSIFHIAVLYRHAAIFNLIHEIRSIRNFVVTYEDADQNNLLHCAAKLAPPNQLNLVSGAAFQMMRELRWFEVILANMECVVQGIIETQHVEALEILLQGLCGVQRERLRIHEICLKSGPHLGSVPSELRLLCDLEQAEPSWGAQITVTVSSINKMLKLHATDEAVPVTPGIQMVEVTAPAAAETYTEVAAAVSSFCEYLAPLLHLSKPGISTGVVPTAAAAAASLMSDGGGTTL